MLTMESSNLNIIFHLPWYSHRSDAPLTIWKTKRGFLASDTWLYVLDCCDTELKKIPSFADKETLAKIDTILPPDSKLITAGPSYRHLPTVLLMSTTMVTIWSTWVSCRFPSIISRVTIGLIGVVLQRSMSNMQQISQCARSGLACIDRHYIEIWMEPVVRWVNSTAVVPLSTHMQSPRWTQSERLI